MIQRILDWKPDICVLVDFPGFHLRVGEQLRLHGVKVVQISAPKLWAWGGWRLTLLRHAFDKVLGILPFETSFFARRGIPYTYVGSPVRDRVDALIQDPVRRREAGEAPVIGLLPGSRKSEVSSIFPIQVSVVRQVLKRFPDARFLVPVAENLRGFMQPFEEVCRSQGLPIEFRREESLKMIDLCDAAVVASGTATLETALLRVPLVVVYRPGRLTQWIGGLLINVRFVSLVNLCLDEALCPEFIRGEPHAVIADALCAIIEGPAREAQLDGFERLREIVQGGASLRMAREIAALV